MKHLYSLACKLSVKFKGTCAWGFYNAMTLPPLYCMPIDVKRALPIEFLNEPIEFFKIGNVILSLDDFLQRPALNYWEYLPQSVQVLKADSSAIHWKNRPAFDEDVWDITTDDAKGHDLLISLYSLVTNEKYTDYTLRFSSQHEISVHWIVIQRFEYFRKVCDKTLVADFSDLFKHIDNDTIKVCMGAFIDILYERRRVINLRLPDEVGKAIGLISLLNFVGVDASFQIDWVEREKYDTDDFSSGLSWEETTQWEETLISGLTPDVVLATYYVIERATALPMSCDLDIYYQNEKRFRRASDILRLAADNRLQDTTITVDDIYLIFGSFFEHGLLVGESSRLEIILALEEESAVLKYISLIDFTLLEPYWFESRIKAHTVPAVQTALNDRRENALKRLQRLEHVGTHSVIMRGCHTTWLDICERNELKNTDLENYAEIPTYCNFNKQSIITNPLHVGRPIYDIVLNTDDNGQKEQYMVQCRHEVPIFALAFGLEYIKRKNSAIFCDTNMTLEVPESDMKPIRPNDERGWYADGIYHPCARVLGGVVFEHVGSTNFW